MFKYLGKSVTGPQPQSTANNSEAAKPVEEDPRIAAMKRRMLEKSRVSAFGGKKNGVS